MTTLAFVPSQLKSAVLATPERARTYRGVVKLLEALESDPPELILAVMGGPLQSVLMRAAQQGIPIQRLPWFKLEDLTGVGGGTSAEDKAGALHLAWGEKPEAFYPMEAPDGVLHLLRELTRVRLAIQETYRKPAQLQYQAAFRDLEPLLPQEGRLVRLRTTFADSAMIAGAKEDEKALENEIAALVKDLPIWQWLHPGPRSVLPEVKGLGPSLGGSLIGEIGDIHRFPSDGHLRSYARYGLTPDGKMKRRRKGEVANWNDNLHRAVWLWSTSQMPRYDHIWRRLYDYIKAMELMQYPEPVQVPVVRQDGSTAMVWRYSLRHLDLRAKRRVGSHLLHYVYSLWTHGAESGDPEAWYASSNWPLLFADIERKLQGGLDDYLAEQIALRRRNEPAGEEE